MVYILILFPLCMAVVALSLPSNRLRPFLVPITAIVHSVTTIFVLVHPAWGSNTRWLILDPVSTVLLISISTLYLCTSFYTLGYLNYWHTRSNRFFTASLLAFLGLISLVIWSHNLGLMWVAMEGTVLVTAPLISFNHSKRSIEATWKYLLVGSVGIALALLGTFFLAYSAVAGGFEATLDLEELICKAPALSKIWLRSSFILFLVGYGTKMGLAPMHTWKPDAYGEAPGVAGAILAGAVTSGSFLSLLRIYQICNAAGESAYISPMLRFIGLFSMAVAGIFMIRQRDFKRMLAYSSVEHMGILVLGLGIGLPALFGTLLHVLTNAMTKGVLFLSAGNIHRSFGSKNTDQVQGALRRVPVSAILFLAGFFAITGSPPFAPFVSEFSILNGAFTAGHFVAGSLFLFFLLVVFIGMGTTVLKMVQGRVPSGTLETGYHDSFSSLAPILCLMAIVLYLGLFLPVPLQNLLRDAANFLENK